MKDVYCDNIINWYLYLPELAHFGEKESTNNHLFFISGRGVNIVLIIT